MRICSPHCGLEPLWSGGAVYERELLSAVARQGVIGLHLPMPAGKVVPEILTRAVEPARPRRGWRWWLAPLFAVPAIRRCWNQHGFDILRAHSARFMGPACLLTGLRPLVVHHHHLDGIWQESVDRAVLKRADLVTTDSRASLRRLQGLTRARLVIVPPGVGQEFFEAVASHGKSAVANLLFLGELKARKNPLALPRILRRVLDRGGLAELTVVGDGPLRAELERAVRHGRLEGGVEVRLLGRVPDAARPALYAAADVFLFPTRLEGFGMTVLEAMATGLPVVATATGAIPELIEHGRTGFLVTDPDDIDLFADYVLTLLKSPALRREMGAAARAEAARWTWGRSARQLEALCRELV